MSLFLRRSHPIILLFLSGLFFFFLVRTEQFPPNSDLLSLGITLVFPFRFSGYILPEGNQNYLKLSFFVDDPDRFVEAISEYTNNL